MTPVDCDPVVGEVVEDTRAAVEEMMKELNDMVEQPTPSPQFTMRRSMLKRKPTVKEP